MHSTNIVLDGSKSDEEKGTTTIKQDKRDWDAPTWLKGVSSTVAKQGATHMQHGFIDSCKRILIGKYVCSLLYFSVSTVSLVLFLVFLLVLWF